MLTTEELKIVLVNQHLCVTTEELKTIFVNTCIITHNSKRVTAEELTAIIRRTTSDALPLRN